MVYAVRNTKNVRPAQKIYPKRGNNIQSDYVWTKIKDAIDQIEVMSNDIHINEADRKSLKNLLSTLRNRDITIDQFAYPVKVGGVRGGPRHNIEYCRNSS